MSTYLPASPETFVVGMMAFFGAVGHAPMAVIVMASEMSGSYTMLGPAMIATGLAYLIMGRNSIYESQVSSPAASPAYKYEYISSGAKKHNQSRKCHVDQSNGGSP